MNFTYKYNIQITEHNSHLLFDQLLVILFASLRFSRTIAPARRLQMARTRDRLDRIVFDIILEYRDNRHLGGQRDQSIILPDLLPVELQLGLEHIADLQIDPVFFGDTLHRAAVGLGVGIGADRCGCGVRGVLPTGGAHGQTSGRVACGGVRAGRWG